MRILKCAQDERLSDEDLETVVEALKDGEIMVYPTETVYGIGADPTDTQAVYRVFKAKKRPFDLPVPIAVSDLDMMKDVAYLGPAVEKLFHAFLPGPLALMAPKRKGISDAVTSGQDLVAIRVPDSPSAVQIIEAFGPIISTSANIHGGPNPVNAEIAIEQLGESVPIYVDAGPSKVGVASTIVEVTDKSVRLVRKGPISLKEIEDVLERD